MPKQRIARRKPIKQHSLGGVTVTVQQCSKPGYAARVVSRKDGKLVKEKYCETQESAKTVFDSWVMEISNTGTDVANKITDRDKRLLLEWGEKLAPYGKTPADAVAHYLAYLDRCKVNITVAALCDKYQALKSREKMSRRYLDDLHYRLGIFCQLFGGRIAGDVTTDEISAWLAGMEAAAQTKKNYRRIVGTLFNYGVMLKACAENPVTAAFKPSKEGGDIGILKVKEAAALLHAAHERPDILPAIALGLFAGVRDAELHRLDWSEIGFESGFITIKPAQAKKKARRLIELRPALRAWLEPLRQISGPIWPAGERGRILHEAAREAAGLTAWPHNALRHSFASYALAKWQNAAALALEMGNSPHVIMEHYRELVLPSEAEAFWSLTPAKVLHAPNILSKAKVAKTTTKERGKAAMVA